MQGIRRYISDLNPSTIIKLLAGAGLLFALASLALRLAVSGSPLAE